MTNNAKIFTLLESLLRDECSLYKEYLKILEAERASVVKGEIDLITEKAARRAVLCGQMAETAKKRLSLLKHFPEGDAVKVSEIVVRFGSASDAARILPLVRDLKLLIEESKSKGQEFGQVLNFTQRLVDGTISILWSATQSINRIYTRAGQVKESMVPSRGYTATLKRA